MDVTSDNTTLTFHSLRRTPSHFMKIWKEVSWNPLTPFFELNRVFFLSKNVVAQTHGPCHSQSRNKSAKSRGGPSVPCKSTAGADTVEWAKALPQDTASMRDHLRIQARYADRLRMGGASRALAEAEVFTKSSDSVLHRPRRPKGTCLL